jgi:AAA ATPase domain
VTALVGREEERELLLRRWSRAKTGEGQVVLLSGEGGIGKSRLTAALLEHLATEPHTRLRYFCSPQHTDSAFHPIIGQMERAAGLGYDDKPQAKLNKLDAVGDTPNPAARLVRICRWPTRSRMTQSRLWILQAIIPKSVHSRPASGGTRLSRPRTSLL